MFEQSQNFLGSDRKIFGQEKFFEHRKSTTFAGQSSQIHKKDYGLKVKILSRSQFFRKD